MQSNYQAVYGSIIFVPGMLGSRLKLEQGGQVVWGDLQTPLVDFNLLKLPGPRIKVDGVVESIVVSSFAPRYFHVYKTILDHLRHNLGFSDNVNLFLFAYDWRQDCAENAARLKHFIKLHQWAANPVKFTILAHSMGGLIARSCVQSPGGDAHVRSIIVMGTPHWGTPDAFESLMKGAKVFPFNFRQNDTHAALRTFPSAYQLLPTHGRFMRDNQDYAVDLADARNQDWLDPNERALMKRAVKFHKRLDTAPIRVPIYSIYGYRQKSLKFVKARGTQPRVRWERAHYRSNRAGDARVPEGSAKFISTLSRSVRRKHEDLFNNPDAHKYIKDILTGTLSIFPPSTNTSPSVFIDCKGNSYGSGSPVDFVFGVLDAAGRIIPADKFTLKLWSESVGTTGTPLRIVQLTPTNATGPARMEQVALTLPAGAYFAELEAVLPLGTSYGTAPEYFVVE